MKINDLVNDIHKNAVNHGWWDEERSLGEVIALCHSELSEALEEDRAGRPMVWHECRQTKEVCKEINCLSWEGDGECDNCSINPKPEGIAVEMIDCVIRIFDWCGKCGLDVEKLLLEKHEYNKQRPYKHGKRY